MHIKIFPIYLFKRFAKIFYPIFFLLSFSAFSEGTKQVTPNSSNKAIIELNNSTTNIPFAAWNCPVNYRLNIRIFNHLTEKIYLGFQASGSNISNIYWRLKDPTGAIVVGPTLIPTAPAVGYCNTYDEAVAGPAQLGITGGYNAFVYTPPTLDGDYYIEFNVGTTLSTKVINLKLFDITVANGATASSIKLGRLWSKDWELQTQSGSEPFLGIMYVYSNDGIVTRLNMNGIKPGGFHVACNSKGTINSGNYADDRVSVIANQSYPEYKIFLNDPDPICYPSGTWGSLKGVTIDGCAPNYCINVNIDKTSPIGVIIDLNGQPGFQPNTTDISIAKDNAVAGINCISWNGRDGLDSLVKTGTPISVQVDFFNGVTNLPLYDVEDNPNGFIVSLVRPAPPVATDTLPAIYWDDSQIIAGTAIDSKTNLTGCKSATGCHKWSGRGNNSCVPSCPETINTWWYANRQTQTVPFTTFYVEVDANTATPGKGTANKVTRCGIIAPITLSASRTGASGITWSSSGTGTFSNLNALNATYTPSGTDLNNKSVKLTITTTGNTNGVSTCPAATDFYDITLQVPPTVNAGTDMSYCANKPNIALKGTFANGVSAIAWSGGSGTYAPNSITKDATYTPTATEIKAGKVTLTIKATAGSGACPAPSDQVVFSIDSVQRVKAGVNGSICENNSVITLAGSLGNGGTTPVWSGGTGTFSNKNSLTSTYTPGSADITAKTVTLTLTASKATCNNVSSTVSYTITPKPTVDAGTDLPACANNLQVTLNGAFTVATGIQWVGGTGTFSPDRTTKNAKYIPSAAEINAKMVTLTLESTGNGTCTKVTDDVIINIAPTPVARAGNDTSTCANNPGLTLLGSVTGATGGTWTGAGGTFSPDNNTLHAKYTPSTSEIEAGNSFLILTTTGNGTCIATTDTILIVTDPSPAVDAGHDTTVCKNKLSIQLNGTTANNTTQTWSTSGTGTFNNVNLTNAVYAPSASDTSGIVTLTLKVNRAGCMQVSDHMVISFIKAPSVNAGANISICKNNAIANLNGFSSTGTGIWSGGTGILTASQYTATTAETNAGTPVTLTYTSTDNASCNAVKSQLQVSFFNAPAVDAGIDQNICINNSNVLLTGKSSTGSAVWQGGNGTFAPDTNALVITYTPTDTELNTGSVTLTLSSKNNGACLPENDQVLITFTPGPVVNAGTAAATCANNPDVSLTGVITNASGGIWSNGGGSFANASTVLTNKYTPSSTEVQNGQVKLKLTSTGNGNCNAVSDSIFIGIDPAPIVNAGADQVVCGDVSSVTLAGTISHASGTIWSKTGFASGTFSDINALNSTYSPSASDIDSGYVDLQLASGATGTCLTVKDIVRIYFTNVPSINAGPDQTVCANDFPVILNALGSPGIWSGGAGTFSPSAHALNASYIPTSSEITTGSVKLTYTTDATATCISRTDQAVITLKPAPIVDAGTTIPACSNTSGIQLNGSVSNAGGGKWSTMGSGSFIPDVNALNASYVPSANDGILGAVYLILTSTGNAQCPAVTDTVMAGLIAAPLVNAGADQNICVNAVNIPLNATIQNINGAGGVWSGGSGTFSPDRNSPTASYVPASGEISSGSLTLTYSSISNGDCPVISDQVVFTFVVSPTANAGADQTVCETLVPVNVTATTTSATTGNWFSLGSGSFAPGNSGKNAGYVSSAADIANGFVNLVFETSDNKSCQPARDTVKINYTLAPVVMAGKDTSICIDATSITLYGQAIHASGLRWRSSGTGAFDDNTKADALYTPSVNDKNGGAVTLTLTGRGNGTCASVRSTMVLRFIGRPIVFTGPARSACEDLDSVSLIGKITNAGGGKWTTAGTGTFKNADSVQTYYYPSLADKSAKVVTLMLTSTQNGLCTAVSSSFDLKFDVKPTINIGMDQTVCADSVGISLTAALTNAASANWYTSGTGTFAPNANAVNVTYLPSLKNRNTRQIKIWASTNGAGSCAAVTDTMNLTLNPSPIVNAGTPIITCIDKDSVQLSGSVVNAAGGKWYSSGTGTFTPNDSTLQAVYHPSAIDKANGNIVLTLRSTGNGLCKSMAGQVSIRFSKIPVVDAGKNTTYCNNAESVALNGIVTYATGGQWSSTGGGSILPDNSNLNANYYPTAAEVSAGSAKLILNTTGNGNCSSQKDSVIFTFQKAPSITAGPDATICADLKQTPVSATVSNSVDYTWSTLGSGTFNPGNTTLTTNYAPSANDISAQKVGLVISTVNDGACTAAKDTLYISIIPLPIISVGNDIVLCADAGGVQLSASFSNATGVKWNSSGDGSFSPNDSTALPFYYIGKADQGLENIALTATTTGHGSCKSKSDELTITFNPVQLINAGPDIAACIGAGPIQLNGTITNTSGATWLTSGSGTFLPNSTTLNATYTPSASDENSGQINITLVGDATAVCQSNSDAFAIKFSALPVVNAGKDSVYCTNSLPIQLSASGASGSWSGGSGVFTPNATALKGTYQPTAAEIAAGTVTLIISTNPGLCPVTSDNVIFTIKQGPSVDAGIDTTICVNTTGFNLYGKNNGNSSGIIWSTASGTGTFSPSATDPNASFIPSEFQIGNGRANITLTSTGNNGCPASADKILVYITPAPVINAGFDITSCKDVSTITLKGSKQPPATNTVWTTSSAPGSFTDAANVNTIFTPDPSDISNGLISLYLTVPGSTLCKAITDTMHITFSPIPTIFAGNDSTLCANTANKLSLDGKVNFASGGVWTSTGAGTFSPNANSPKAIYRPTTNEINSGQISITFTSTGNGACQLQADPVVFTLQKPDTVNAGSDTTVCADQNALTLIGKSTTPNIKWTGSGTGTFSPDNNLNTMYVLGASDIKNGGITVTLTSTNINTCAPAVDFITLIFNPAPVAIVNAGLDQTACISETQFQMNGFIANAEGGKWTTSGDGSFIPSDTTLDATYVIGTSDKVNGTVNIRLTSTGNGICGAVTDIMKLTLQSIPTIKVSAKNIPACADADSIIVSAKVTTATSGLWKSTGNGIFAPKSDSLTTHYFPTTTDINNGQVWLIAESVNNGACPAVSDTAFVTFGPAPTIDAGTDMHVCRNVTSIALKGTTTIAAGGQWTSSGAGTFAPNGLTATYQIATADTSSNVLIMKVTSTGQGSCKPVSDDVTYTFDPIPTVNAGADVSVCESVKAIPLNGTAQFTSDYSWVSTGTGTFVPDNKSLHATYQPSAADTKSGNISISLISSLVNSCTPIADQMTITFIRRPALTISTAPACYSFKGMNVTGTVANATGANWYSTGSGNFSPDNSKLISQYVFGSKDLSKNITLYLVSNAGICPSDTISAAVFVNPAPKTNAGADRSICPNNKTTITANTLANAKYQWTEITGSVVSIQAVATVTLAATKSYQLQITDANKCIGYDTVKVNVVQPIKFNMAVNTCLDPYTPINSKPAKYNPAGTFQWYKDGNILQGQVDTTILVNSAGAYTIVYNLDQCASDSTIQVHPLPTMVNSGKIVCVNSKATIKTSKLPAGSSYTWKAPLPNVNSNTNTVTSTKLGTTFYFVTGTDLHTCKKTDSIRVIGLAKPVIVLNDTSFCSSTSFNLNAKPKNSSAYAGLSIKYVWLKDRIDQQTDTNMYLVKQQGLYKAIVSIEECTSSDSSLVNMYTSPVTILPADTVFCPSAKGLNINAGFGTANQTQAPGTTYTWKNIDGNTIIGKAKIVNVKEGGLYSVEIKNFNKCTVTDTITVEEMCGPRIFVPTAFTPGKSDSGKDQVFLIQGKYFKNFTLIIYNRWGEVMFTSKGTSQAESWDGTYLGQDVASGTYPYQITFDAVDPQYESQKMAGSITLLR